MYSSNVNQGDSQAFVNADSGIGPALIEMLLQPEIQPGSAPGYQLCKTIFSYHPLGAILTDAPISRAQAKPRTISIPKLGEKRLVQQYEHTWKGLGKSGATLLLHNLFSTARIYGIASLAVGEVGADTSKPLDVNTLAKADLFFNILDPLNTAGSLVLNQDPNAPDFLKPRGPVSVNGQVWHPSRLFTKMNEQPLYIDWTTSAFGFVGRSVYQRALYPLKSFIQSMITDQMVVQKAGLLVYRAKEPGSFIDNVMQTFFGAKRAAIKAGVTGQVLSIGTEEAIETLNMMNLDKAFGAARMDILKNVASAARMPASIMAQETLTEGFGEGTEDIKKEIEFLDRVREEMDPAYQFLDSICRRKAWTPEFYETMLGDYSEYKSGGFETALHEWISAFNASWPNLMMEPESEKVNTQDVQFKSVIAMLETILPEADPATKAKLISWAADNVNDRDLLFASKLIVDEDELKAYFEKNAQAQPKAEGAQEEPSEPRPFSRSA